MISTLIRMNVHVAGQHQIIVNTQNAIQTIRIVNHRVPKRSVVVIVVIVVRKYFYHHTHPRWLHYSRDSTVRTQTDKYSKVTTWQRPCGLNVLRIVYNVNKVDWFELVVMGVKILSTISNTCLNTVKMPTFATMISAFTQYSMDTEVVLYYLFTLVLL
jgi:hypothetical protein